VEDMTRPSIVKNHLSQSRPFQWRWSTVYCRGPSSFLCYLQWNTSLTTDADFGRVCLYVCQIMTFESLDVESSFSLITYIHREYGSSCIWRSSGQGQGHGNKNVENICSHNVKVRVAITLLL